MYRINKKEEVLGWADQKMNDLHVEWCSVLNTLWDKAKKTYIKAEALKVYDLTRPDGEAAQTDLNRAKYSLLCSIGRYDNATAEIKRHYSEHQDEMQRNWNMNFRTSHEQIKFAIREILKGD